MKPSLTIIAYINIVISKLYRFRTRSQIGLDLLTHIRCWTNPQVSSRITTLLILIIASQPIFGTAIVVLRAPDYMVIAADSKATDIEGNALPEWDCKIAQINKLFFSYSGLIDYPKPSFHATNIIIEAARSANSVLSAAITIERVMRTPLARLARHLKENDLAYYRKHSETREIFSVIFYAMEKGVPKYCSRHFIPKTQINGEVILDIVKQDCPGTCSSAAVTRALTFMPLGDVEKLTAYYDGLQFTGEIIQGNNLVQLARKLIQVEMDSSPNVGGPIAVLRITKDGAEWIEKGACRPETQNIIPKPGSRKRRRSKT